MVESELSTEPQEFDLDKIPRIDAGKESEWSDGDTSSESAITEHNDDEPSTTNSEHISEAVHTPKPNTPSDAGSRARRRTRGVSLLPIRQPTHLTSPSSPTSIRQRYLLSGSPPTTTLPNVLGTSPTAYSSPIASSVEHTPLSATSSNQTPLNIYTNRPKLNASAGASPANHSNNISIGNINTSCNNSSSCSNNISGSGKNSGNSSTKTSPNNQKLTIETKLSECMTHLAIKESKVGDLRLMLTSLKQELHEAEADLAKYKNSVKVLAEMVHSQPSDISHQTPDHHHTEGTSAEKDVLGISRRVVDGIGSQFWSFLDDVRSATMGNMEFDDEHPDQAENRGRNTIRKKQSALEQPPASPRRLSPKKSIQNFIRSRPASPIRMSPARQQAKQEQAELRASQRLRESQRLTNKLSQLDLRSPSPVRN